MTVVALDGMGGDLAPGVTVEGAIRAAERGVDVALVGDSDLLGRELERLGGAPSGVRVVHASDAIGMQEHVGLETRRRHESSIYVAMELVKGGEAQAFVSLGNTGAVLTLALVVLGKLPGVERPRWRRRSRALAGRRCCSTWARTRRRGPRTWCSGRGWEWATCGRWRASPTPPSGC